jgi:hypothetical protein
MYPFRDLNLFADVPAGLIYYQKEALLLSDSYHPSLANSLSAIENSSTLTVGRISQ